MTRWDEMNWLMAARHVARETLIGLRGGLADVRHVLADRSTPLTPEQKELLLLGESDRQRARAYAEWADPFGIAKMIRENDARNRRDEEVAENWLEDQERWSPGISELARVGDRPLMEFHEWMTRPHGWLSVEDDVWPQGVWESHRSLIEERWLLHVEQIRDRYGHGG